MGKALDLPLGQRPVACQISETWDKWKRARIEAENEKRELRNYIFATDTSSTTNANLPWKNSTTVPKLCQLRDNLHANYMAALFPNPDWLYWEGWDEEGVRADKAKAIQAYMSNKLDLFQFRSLVSQFVYDYIDYGNVFGGVKWINEYKQEENTGEVIPGRIGPCAYRISFFDHVFDPTAITYRDSPKITRQILTLGELSKLQTKDGYIKDEIGESLWLRQAITQYGTDDVAKIEAYTVDGFGSLWEYYTSGYAEILEFEGDFYDVDSGEYLPDRIITVVDRRTVIRNIQNPSWMMNNTKHHVGWRLRPDNLIAMGPLDNLVGMQYRIDHLENAKADAIDQYVHPAKKIRGVVEEFSDEPGERIYIRDDGDVEFLRPPLDQILAQDNEIIWYSNMMEELAGAPKQAMGIRTPGEKTAYEVQSLENAAGRIFQNKIEHFESEFLEPLLNAMLELSVRQMSGPDLIRVMDDDLGVIDFMTITKEDITAAGKLKPRGARHFAAKAKLVQEVTQWMSSPVGADPTVKTHISGKAIARLMEESLGLEKFKLYGENVAIIEQAETQRMINSAQQIVEEEDMTPIEG